MSKQFVRDLSIGEKVFSDFMVIDKSLVAFTQPNRCGEQFLRMQLADLSGTIRAVAWEKGPELSLLFNVGDIIRVRGEVSEYKGLQLVVYNLELVPAEQVNRGLFQRTAPRDRQEMLVELQAVKSKITNPFLADLINYFFDDKELFSCFIDAPAARSVHHNYLGGLLEHSLEVAFFCKQILSVHPEIDASLLYSGALLHDIGKIEEYDINSLTFELTNQGKLLGHISIGVEMVSDRVKRINDFPSSLHMELAHIILSHHGHKEWGSPEVPKTFAAFALFHADLLSARLNQFAQASAKGAKENGWTEWDRLLDRSIFLGLAE